MRARRRLWPGKRGRRFRRGVHARHLTRLGVPDDIANAAIYLASDESEFVPGSHINVEGGVLVKSRPNVQLIAQ
jgi:NAD(P)-dependent dehydrogenase (short-subunit alcohol dehydrogenase family)